MRKLTGIIVAVMFFGGQAWMAYQSQPQRIPSTSPRIAPGPISNRPMPMPMPIPTPGIVSLAASY